MTIQEAAAHSQQELFRWAASSTRGEIIGYLVYMVEDHVKFDEAPYCEYDTSNIIREHFVNLETNAGRPFGELLTSWLSNPRTTCSVLPIFLDPGMAERIVNGHSAILHIVAITHKLNRQRVLCDAPGKKMLRSFLRSHAPPAAPRLARRRLPLALQRIVSGYKAHPVEDIMDWVRATQDIKRLRRSEPSAKNWARLFRRGGLETTGQMLQRLSKVNAEQIRLARVRLDVVAALLNRRFFEALIGEGEVPAINLWADSSPQWRGRELFAASFEIASPRHWSRRVFPFVSPQLGCTAFGKVVTLLWQIFLVVGPSITLMRQFTNNVIAITTDMGTESKLADFPDILHDFYWFISGSDALAATVPRQAYLFPVALVAAGWRHIFDTVLKRTLNSLPFMARWMELFKAK
jgi:hypothetical protein